ncbi:DUF1127 domain-containing protein [Kaistia dalseonensis]|uniref:Uncharacterized protein YjiS (DUF1127 family) n=1 Tax=Kaistia dalseonensis TaxID=410840 RepID=A0ABU0H9E5_9HYPH|nr:DUF1127 domain-containing protein [Kaistia dalseonensis]MCX5495495.1 DUF1127 domain-containing protein [Kaistia dalseonensis]MDQ0438086.1 uncharacterized protein YjiS (DUF1127 family) [Kaistia dalseonensis]
MTTYETFSTSTRVRRGRTILTIVAAVAAPVTARVRAWKNRRSVARLLEWDDRMLSDIGLTQGDVYCAMSARADEDPSVQLSMLALERRFAHQAQMRDRLNRGSEVRVASARYRRKA